jgi:hypothetical protein
VYQNCASLSCNTHTGKDGEIQDKGVARHAREHVAILLSLPRTTLPTTDRNACNGGLMLTQRCHLDNNDDLLGLTI